MLLVRRIVFLIPALLSIALILIFAVAGYVTLISSDALTQTDLKYLAERILFTGILAGILAAIIFLIVFFKSININQRLEKLIRQNKLNPASTEHGLSGINHIGQKLNILYSQINEISEMRGLKMSALSNTCEYLSSVLEKPLLVIDITGRVIQVSEGWLNQNNQSRSEVIGTDIKAIYKVLDINSVLQRLEKKHLPLKLETEESRLQIEPVLDKNNSISYVVVIPN